jgi:hypothetical protein
MIPFRPDTFWSRDVIGDRCAIVGPTLGRGRAVTPLTAEARNGVRALPKTGESHSRRRDCHRPVVYQRDRHHRGEASSCDRTTERGAREPVERLIERNRKVGFGGVIEGRSRAFSGAREQRKLADDKDAARNIHDRAIHLSVVVFEDPQRADFFGQPLCVGFRVGLADAKQHEQAGIDLSGQFTSDCDAGAGYSLNDGAHHVKK